ncbi:MAG: TIGR04282 family arsenosugar biosynthesis glycosyltransferase [Rhodocyclaceae bacterium]
MSGFAERPHGIVILFAKAPVPGLAKTRLVPALGAEAAAHLQARLATRAIETALAAAVGPVELWCAPDCADPFFAECARRHALTLRAQPEGDLGRRMARAFEAALASHDYAILTGSDCPAMTAQDIRAARDALAAGQDAAFLPVEDGGYALIGLARFDPRLFEAIAWGSGAVMRETRLRLGGMGWRWQELAERWDVDRPEDLERLRLATGMADSCGMR